MMKNLKLSFIVLCTIIITTGFQNKKEDTFIIFYENHDLKAIQKDAKNKHQLGYQAQASQQDLQTANKIAFTAAELKIEVQDDKLFYLGFNSPNKKEVIYSVTDKYDPKYKVFRYDKNSDKQQLIIQTGDGPNEEHAYVPFGFTDNPDVLYVEAINLKIHKEHLGIWTYNMKTGAFKKLPVTDKYMTRPIISTDRTELFYTATSNPNYKDEVHGVADKILQFQMKGNVESTLIHTPAKQLNIQGLYKGELKNLKLTNEEDTGNNTNFKNKASGFKLPWNEGERYCVTRDGTPRPPASSLSNGGICNYSFNHHGYKAIDFSNARVTGTFGDNIRASKEGEVITAGYQGPNGTYGNLVRLLHDDGQISYYAHLSGFNVSVGDCVGQGELVGKEGGTGNECCGGFGEHLHFEVRTTGASGSQIWVTFDEYGETTRRNDLATSGNAASTCGVEPLVAEEEEEEEEEQPVQPEHPLPPIVEAQGEQCETNITTASGNIPAKTYEASNKITSAGTVNSGTVNFKSPAIELKNGFSVSSGVFKAENVNCTSNKIVQPGQELIAFGIYPNPVSRQAYISFTLSEEQAISIRMHDVSGKLISALVNDEVKNVGQHQITFDVADETAGVYYVTIQSDKNLLTRKMIITK